MNYTELASRDIKDLRQLAAKYGIKTGPRSKAETIAKLIVEHIASPQVKTQDQLKHVAETPKAASVVNTEDQVRDVIKVYTAKPEFTVQFPGDDTWIFRCRGAEESGHMSCALRVIKMKADSVSKGARKPRGIQDALHGGTSDIVMMIG